MQVPMNPEILTKSLHNKVIPYKAINMRVPYRKDFLQNDDVKKVNNILKKKEEILFLPTFVEEINLQDEKYGEAFYKIVLTGIFADGRKVNIILDGIPPYFEVQLSDNEKDHTSELNKINIILNKNSNTVPVNTYLFESKPFKGYQTHTNKFLRLYYTKLENRKMALNTLINSGYKGKTASDDLSYYYKVVCRNYLITFSSWSVITNYTEYKNTDRFKGTTYKVNIKNYKSFKGELTNDLLRDKTMSCCWDIETWSKNGDLPQPNNPNDRIFCIGLTFQWVNEKNPFLRVCLCDFPAEPKEEYLTIVCGNEENIIKGFAEIISHMQPDLIFGFNDSDYDWNWIINRGIRYKGLLTYMANQMSNKIPYYPFTDDSVYKYNVRHVKTKLEANVDVMGTTLLFNGCIPVDVRTTFRKLIEYKTAEKSSLKFFLENNKLGGKEDMPYQTMFNIYNQYIKFLQTHADEYDQVLSGNHSEMPIESWTVEEINKYKSIKSKLRDVNYYCVIDAQRCHDLMFIRSMVMNNREVANLSFCSLYDAFYRADGMKVRNLTIAVGQQHPFNMRFTNINNDHIEEGKYLGAFVLHPNKGLKTSKLSIQERIRKAHITKDMPRPDQQLWLDTDEKEIKQFHSIIEEFGAIGSPEKVKIVENKYGELPKKFVDFWYEPIGRPVTGLDFSSLYPSLIRAYNFSPEYCILDKKQAEKVHVTGQKLTKVDFLFMGVRRVGYFIWHNNKYNTDEEGFQFGVIPYILDDLFKKRKTLKHKQEPFNKRKEILESISKEELEKMTEEERSAISKEYEEVVFNRNYIESKQKALKVFMNTFYGVTGDKRTPFFLVELAGGITSYGQKNIKLAYAFVKEKQCNVHYGDTDSLYLSAPEYTFDEIDKSFYSGKIDKLQYWTEMVSTTMVQIKNIQTQVNDMFKETTQTDFLSMAYEEVLYNVALLAKKKYFAIAHESQINFSPKHLFIKGLEVIKRGVSGLLRTIFNDIMWTACSPDNIYSLLELVLMKIDEIYATKWGSKDFVQTDVYRPGKKNIKIITFVKAMKERGIEIKPNERFEYVFIKKYPYKYDLRGRKIELMKGELMELASEFDKHPEMEIDLDTYMQGSINGQLARLITYHPMFHVDPVDDSDDEIKKAEVKIYANAGKFIDSYCEKYYNKYNTFGKTFQKMYKTANSALSEKIKQHDYVTGELLSANANLKDVTEFQNWFEQYTLKKARDLVGNYGEEFIKNELHNYKTRYLDSRNYTDDTDNKNVKKELKKELKKVISEKSELLQHIYNKHIEDSLHTKRNIEYKNRIAILKSKLKEKYNEYVKLYAKYNNSIGSTINVMSNNLPNLEELFKPVKDNKEYNLDDFEMQDCESQIEYLLSNGVDDMFNNPNFIKNINDMKNLYNNMVAAHTIMLRNDSISEYLESLKNKETKIITRTSDVNNDVNDIKNSNKEEVRKLDL